MVLRLAASIALSPIPAVTSRRIPVGRTKFYEDYVATGRLTLIPLGLRAKAVDDDEIDRVIEEDIAAAHRKRNSRHGRSMP